MFQACVLVLTHPDFFFLIKVSLQICKWIFSISISWNAFHTYQLLQMDFILLDGCVIVMMIISIYEHLRDAGAVLSAVDVLSHLIFTTVLWGRPSYCSSFTEEGTEAQRKLGRNLNFVRLTPDPHSDHPQILLPCAVSLREGGGYHCFWFTPDGYLLSLLCYSIPSDVCALCVSHSSLWPLGVSVLLEFSSCCPAVKRDRE